MEKQKILTLKGCKITVNEAADICGVGRTTVWRWLKNGGHPKLQQFDIEAVECIKHSKGFWICDDGEFRKVNWTTYNKSGKRKNLIRINGDYWKVANYVFVAFTGDWYEGLLFLDGDLSNCRLDNLAKQNRTAK